MWKLIAAALGMAIGVQSATAQIIFYEDFAGNALGPHWTTTPNPQNATYTVANGRLTVDWMRPPSGPPGEPLTQAVFRADFLQYEGDFDATVRLGLEPGAHRRIRITFGRTSPNHAAAAFFFDEQFGFAGGTVGGTSHMVPVPPAGTYDFRAMRVGAEVSLWLDSTFLGSVMHGTVPALDHVELDVMYYHPGQSFQPVFFESISVIPAPGTAGLTIGAVALTALRRRRVCRRESGKS